MNTKSNFIISYCKNLWEKDSKKNFIADPYVYHVLERNGEISNIDSIIVAEYLRKNKSDLIEDSNFVDLKYDKYVALLANRLNIIHGSNYKTVFWKKALSMAFIRYITAFYNLFKICETYFDPKIHQCNILSINSYFTPIDFEEHRSFFENSNIGQEQIFSIYLNLFYPNRFSQIEIPNSGEVKTQAKWTNKIKSTRLYLFIKSIYFRIKYKAAKNKISIGIFGSFFSKENLKTLEFRSNNKIYPLNLTFFDKKNRIPIKEDKRELVSAFESDFDKFDKFFFTSLKFCLPSTFIEGYKKIESYYNVSISKFPQMKFVISEAWLSDTYYSIAIAIMQKKGIKHIYNEHNCFFHPYAGSFVKHVCDMCDIYATLGWEDISNPKIIKAASLFPFAPYQNQKKQHKILFIAGVSGARTAHYSAAWGYSEENVPKTISFNSAFFENLSKPSILEITYRGYPILNVINLQLYDKEYYYKNFISQFKLADYKKSAKEQMRESHLVIVDYLSTAHLESILMNIPTVFFWDEKAYYLNENYIDFYQSLIDVGICQTNPVEAASFIDRIKDNPEQWWSSEEVKRGRNEFINRNLGNPETMINYLLGLLK